MKALVFLFSVFTINFAQANVNGLIPAGYELAQTYLELGPNSVAGASENSWIEFDYNGDGRLDIAMLIEQRFCDGVVKGNICDDGYFGWQAKERTLLIYFKTAKGYDLVLKTQNGILNQGEGGVASPDPLMSFKVNSKGTLHLSYWGGSSMKWGLDYKFQYRKEKSGADFYVVGITTMSQGWVFDSNDEAQDMEIVIEDRNLITGDIVVTRSLMSEDDKETVVKSKEAKKPLVKMSQADQLLNW